MVDKNQPSEENPSAQLPTGLPDGYQPTNVKIVTKGADKTNYETRSTDSGTIEK